MLPAVSYNGEYDVALGRGRVVNAYCARRHTYVMRYAQPIILTGCDPVDPDAALAPEPGDSSPAVEAMREKSATKRAGLVKRLRDHGKPATRQTMIAWGYSSSWLGNNLPHIDEIVAVGGGRNGAKLYAPRERVQA